MTRTDERVKGIAASAGSEHESGNGADPTGPGDGCEPSARGQLASYVFNK